MTVARIANAIRKLPGLVPEREADIDRRAASLVEWIPFILQSRGAQAPKRFKRRSGTEALKEIRQFEATAKRLLQRLNGLSAGAVSSLDDVIAIHNRDLPANSPDWQRVPHVLLLQTLIGIFAGPVAAGAVAALEKRPTPAGKRSAERGQLLAALAARELSFFTDRPADSRSDALIWFAKELFAVFECHDSVTNCVREVVACIKEGADPFERFGGGPIAVSVVESDSKKLN
jgi:hypothetical protein